MSLPRILVAALTLTGPAACVRTPPPAAVQEQAAPRLTPETRTVLTGSEAQELARQCSRISPGPVESEWTPTGEQLDALDHALATELAQQLQQVGPSASPGDYYRQIAGFVINGRRIIYVNGLHRTIVGDEQDAREAARVPGFSWRTNAVWVCDGASIAFGVEYDPATGAFSNFEFNGSVGVN